MYCYAFVEKSFSFFDVILRFLMQFYGFDVVLRLCDVTLRLSRCNPTLL